MNPLLVIIIILGIINGVYYGGKVLMLILMLGALALFGAYTVKSVIRSNRNYRSMPTVSEYKTKTGTKSNGGGLVCSYCGSRSIRNWGRSSADDSERLFICNHCGEHLYRN